GTRGVRTRSRRRRPPGASRRDRSPRWWCRPRARPPCRWQPARSRRRDPTSDSCGGHAPMREERSCGRPASLGPPRILPEDRRRVQTAVPGAAGSRQAWRPCHGGREGLHRTRRPGNVCCSRKEALVDFEHSEKVKALQRQVEDFMDAHIYPNERLYHEQLQANRWAQPPVMEELKAKARAAGLWNLFLPESKHGAGLTNLEYAPL